MSDNKNLVVKVLYFSGILLILRLLWLASVLIKAFPVAYVLLAGLIGMMIFIK
jgi:hypothetical protein